MSSKLKKIIIAGVIVIVLAVLAIGIIPSIVRESKKQTGREWFVKQEKYLEDINTFVDSMDSVFSLYISEDITKETFLESLNTFNDELLILKRSYEQELNTNPVKPETHTYYSKDGSEAVYELYDVLGEILDTAYEDIDTPLTLAYKYIAYSDQISERLVRYYNAKNAFFYEEHPEEFVVDPNEILTGTDTESITTGE